MGRKATGLYLVSNSRRGRRAAGRVSTLLELHRVFNESCSLPEKIRARRCSHVTHFHSQKADLSGDLHSNYIFVIALTMLVILISVPAYSAQVTVGWGASPDSSVTGYKVYYGLSSGNYTFPVRDAGNALSYTIPDDFTASCYYITVSAYNSTEESAKVPELVIYSMAASAGTGGRSHPAEPSMPARDQIRHSRLPPTPAIRWPSVTVDGSSVGAVNTLHIEQCRCRAHYIRHIYRSSDHVYYHGERRRKRLHLAFTISNCELRRKPDLHHHPNTGYTVASVTVDGTALSSPVTSYTFSNVTANHSISATFAAVVPSTYTITSSAGANGSISPSPSATVNSGGSQTFTITPNAGYKVASVTVDGTALRVARDQLYLQQRHGKSLHFRNICRQSPTL